MTIGLSPEDLFESISFQFRRLVKGDAPENASDSESIDLPPYLDDLMAAVAHAIVENNEKLRQDLGR